MEPRASLHPSIRLLGEGPRELERPLLLAAFTGAQGDTAAATLTYLAAQWEAEPVAKIDPEPFIHFTATRPLVRLEEGERVIDWPETTVSVARPAGVDRDVVILTGPEPHFRWREYTKAVQGVLAVLGVEEAVLVHSFNGATPHTRPVPVHLVGADEAIESVFAVPSRRPRYQGPASYGMALVVMLREAGLRVGSLTAIAPFYVGVDPNPYAVRSLVQVIDGGLGASTSLRDIEDRVAEVNEHATAAMRRSDDLRTFVENLEQQFDDADGQTAPVARANPLEGVSVDEIIGDVESFLRTQQRDAPGTSPDGEAHRR